MNILPFFVVVVFSLTVCSGDDLIPLKNALSCLCSSNKGGDFGACCSTEDIWETIELENIDCFGYVYVDDDTSSFVMGLFVFSVYSLQTFMICFKQGFFLNGYDQHSRHVFLLSHSS